VEALSVVAKMGALKLNLKKMRLELDTSDIQQILSIALDEDRDKALAYIKGKLSKQSIRIILEQKPKLIKQANWTYLNQIDSKRNTRIKQLTSTLRSFKIKL